MTTPGSRWGNSSSGRGFGGGGWRGGRDGRGGRGGNSQRGGPRLCRYIEQGERCRYGDSCAFSHDMSNSNNKRNKRSADTPEQQKERDDYNSWKRLIKRRPTPNDSRTIQLLWAGALRILEEGDRDWKQMLPRDLDDEENYGCEHMGTLLSMVSYSGGCSTFVALALPFLSVFTHPAMLDCLSVDTFVGGLYRFISGSNGNRAVLFFQRLCKNLVDAYLEGAVSNTSVETTLIALTTMLHELLKRERRAAFNEDLPDLIDSLQGVAKIALANDTFTVLHVLSNRISELRAIIARASGLLADVEAPNIGGISTTVVKSTYPRQVVVPEGRHDNDNVDITKIKILPTENEIRSDHPEFLPTTDFDHPHFLNDPVERHLDTLFRLLRHDIFGQLKEALGGLINAISGNPALLDSSKLSLGDIQAYPYPKAHPQVSFNQPPALRKKSASERRRWWEDSKRLEEGTLLCFVSSIDNKISLLFLTVSDKLTDPKVKYSLSSHEHLSTVTTKLATRNQADLELLTQLGFQGARGALIEFPGVFLATFIPILENLQTMQRFSRLPFRQWILPDRLAGSAGPRDIPLPLYARGQGFVFQMDCIMKNKGDQFSFNPRAKVDYDDVVNMLEARTSLDRGQCEALVAALGREYAFIQGPPGTGKSFSGVQLMRGLLACKGIANLGPIIVVCYTNHALDQFLEHLIEFGIVKIIRIGGQSKSEVLDGKNLRVVSKDEAKTKSEGYLLATIYKELEHKESRIKRELGLLQAVTKRPDWNNLKYHLQRRYPGIFSHFSRLDEDEFEVVGKDPFEVWRQGMTGKALNNPRDEATTTTNNLTHTATQNIHRLSPPERHRLVEIWVQEIHENKSDQLFELVKETDSLHERLSTIHDEVDRRVLQTADVIGVTTTGLAKRISVLQHVRCKVIICEEAGEVMEPHTVSTLLPSVQHFIQIGDHQQLRPQINNHGLSLESKQGTPYQLDRSQFERLSVGEPGRHLFPVAQLNVQRRMRPEISTLIRSTIYPRLIDHDTTKNLPDVVGMRKNLFWLNHENLEEAANADRHQKSHSNDWEVDMTHALVRHIVRQGVYNSSDIAVLTTYTEQLQKLRAKMRNDFEIVLSDRDEETLAKDGFNEDTATVEGHQTSNGNSQKFLEKKKLSEFLRIATIDNFQGEESKIIIISLVRSNKEKKVGFLKTTNRINVLISRAQHGMYLIGNTDTYLNIPMWAQILGMLGATDSVGKGLGLCCPRHVDTVMEVSEPLDFEKFSPEGGCQLACDRRLVDCGHKCLARCHSNSLHKVFKCPQPCQRLHTPCNHDCQKPTCGEDCGVCMTKLEDVVLPCNHSKSGVACYQTQDLGSIKCNIRVPKEVPSCNHLVEVLCYRDVASPSYKCPTPCGTNLVCGHRCPGTCGRCNDKDANLNPTVTHQKCTKICGRRFGACNHTCGRLCHDGTDCGPCFSPCEVRCSHSRCTLLCHQSCAPCIESCTWFCEHMGNCEMPCAAPCSRLPCNELCSKTLLCGHRCPGICGETCPEGYCRQCCDKLDARVDFLEMKFYGEIDVYETPIVVLGCGHFFTAESLDGLMGMSEVYEVDGNGDFTGLQDVSGALAGAVPCCPDCKCPVRQFATQRYNRVINRAVNDEMSKRFLTSGRDGLRELEQKIVKVEQDLDTSREEIIAQIRRTKENLTVGLTSMNASQINGALKGRYAEYKRLESSIKKFCSNIADKHQPAQKLHEATAHAARKAAAVTATLDVVMANMTVADAFPALARDRRVAMGGQVIQIKTEFIILNDTFSITQALRSVSAQALIKVPSESPDLLAIPFFKKCKIFIKECGVENLPKLAVEVSLFYASIARSFESFCHSTKVNVAKCALIVKIAKTLLEDAREVCKQPFQNAKILLAAVEESVCLMRKQWYEEVTAEEIKAIKAAMVGGSKGFATHSGHWYNCENGHPFAIGECGMPMELARCPECGAHVGGQHHNLAGGVTRATNMETQSNLI